MPTLVLNTVNLRTKFEVLSFTGSKNTMRPQNLKMVTDHGHDHSVYFVIQRLAYQCTKVELSTFSRSSDMKEDTKRKNGGDFGWIGLDTLKAIGILPFDRAHTI